MNALNEVNKVISMISNVSSRHSSMDEDEWLTAEKMAVSRQIPLFVLFVPVKKKYMP